MWAILASRCLYADGAHEFIRTLAAQDFCSLMWCRQFSYYIAEFPLVLLIKLGVTDMNWLRLAFGVGCFLLWPLIMMGCHWLSPKNFWLVVVAAAAGYLNAAYMAIGEHIVAHALFWPALFAILYARPLTPLAALILLVSSTGLLFSYESQLFLCLPLAALSLWRIFEARRSPTAEKKWCWLVLLAAALLCLTAAAIGFYAVVKPENPAELSGFKHQSAELIGQPGWTLTWTVFWIGLMLGVWFSDRVWEVIRTKIVGSVVLLGLVIWGLWPLLAPGSLDPARQFHHRILDLLVPLALLPVAVMSRYRPQWLAEKKRWRLKQLAAVLLLVQSVWQISATCQWQLDLGKMQALLDDHRGVIPFHSTILATSSLESPGQDFEWTMPCLSLAINPSPHIQSLICGESYISPQRAAFWQPFDPLNSERLPALQHYGLDYSNYLAALSGKNVR